MEVYHLPILQAILIFPVVAFLFTIPYMLIQYHKYGSLPLLRVGVVYSFILYLIAAYFLVILPLPSKEEVLLYTSPTTQLVPFTFIQNIIVNTSVVWSQPATYLHLFREPNFYQAIYNVLLLLPFGVYLKYYFNCSFKKTLLFSFLLSLFFEITQLTGLYFIYPRGYRLFDVDDLIINTLGGIIGYAIALGLLKILPNRKKIDDYAYQIGTRMTVWKRLYNVLIDYVLLVILVVPFFFFFPKLPSFYIPILAFLYFTISTIVSGGKTFGKKFLNMQVVTLSGEKAKWYQYLLRYFLLFAIALPLPYYLFTFVAWIDTLNIASQIKIYLTTGLQFFTIGFTFIYYFLSFVQMLKGQTLWYEKWSNTQNKSTITVQEEQTNH